MAKFDSNSVSLRETVLGAYLSQFQNVLCIIVIKVEKPVFPCDFKNILGMK